MASLRMDVSFAVCAASWEFEMKNYICFSGKTSFAEKEREHGSWQSMPKILGGAPVESALSSACTAAPTREPVFRHIRFERKHATNGRKTGLTLPRFHHQKRADANLQNVIPSGDPLQARECRW
jgi:hypothetical protein